MTDEARKQWRSPQVVTRASAIPEFKRKRIVELRQEGLTLAVIAERLGLHVNTVHLWTLRLDLVPRRPCGCAVRGRPLTPGCPHGEDE